MRAFISIEIPAEAKREMAELQRGLQNAGVSASWTRLEGIHLTLKFLGEIQEAQVPVIMVSLVRAGGNSSGFRIEIAGAGAFPDQKNARVVWLGITGDAAGLMKLQAVVEAAMVGAGFEREDRVFTPHLTLGRIRHIRSRDAWLKALDELKHIRLPGFDVKSVCLMKSELKPSGAVYTELGRVALKYLRN